MTRALIRAINQGLHHAGWMVLHDGGLKDGSWAEVSGVVEEHIQRKIARAVKAEREACAKLAWTTPEPNDEYVPLRMAIHDAIRARGQA